MILIEIEPFEIENEIYNSKIKLAQWLYEEIRLQNEASIDFIKETVDLLSLNI